MKRLNKTQAEPVNTAAMPLPKVFAWLNRFAPALEKRGVQFDQLRLILATKNLLAAREPSDIVHNLFLRSTANKFSEHPNHLFEFNS